MGTTLDGIIAIQTDAKTSPVRPIEIVVGKYLAALVVMAVSIAIVAVFPVLLSFFAKGVKGGSAVEWQTVGTGLVGLFLLGGVFALCYIPTLVDGGSGAVFAQAGTGGKLHWLNVTPPAGVSLTKFLFDKPFNIWMGVIGGTVMVLSSHGAEQLIVPLASVQATYWSSCEKTAVPAPRSLSARRGKMTTMEKSRLWTMLNGPTPAVGV